MLELMSYGLTGLAAVVVMAFCFAYGERSSLAPEKHSIETKNKAHEPLSRRSAEGFGALYSGVTGESVLEEVFHG